MNFAVAEPPVKLVLIENRGQGGSINHLGIEVADIDTVDAELSRPSEAGFASTEERDTTCCYAKQDKFWVVNAPNGERCEVYTVLADSATFSGEAERSRRLLHDKGRSASRLLLSGHAALSDMGKARRSDRAGPHWLPSSHRPTLRPCPVAVLPFR